MLLALACVALCLASCAPRMFPSSHGYVLVRTQGELWVPVPDDDPLYEQFEREVLADAFLRRLIDLFEHTTHAYVATDTRNRLRQTVGNYPILVLDSAAPGLLYDVELHPAEERVAVERALGLGRDGAWDAAQVRDEMAAASAPWLLALVGVEARAGAERLPLEQPTTPEAALVAGLAAALDALHLDALNDAAQTMGPFATAPGAEPAMDEARLQRYRALQANSYAWRDGTGLPGDARLPRDQALNTPGVAATFLYGLLRQTGAHTPQRYMLWFLSYKAPEMPLAKLLRVCQRLGRGGQISMQTLVDDYADTYPAEREAVQALFAEVYGAASDGAR